MSNVIDLTNLPMRPARRRVLRGSGLARPTTRSTANATTTTTTQGEPNFIETAIKAVQGIFQPATAPKTEPLGDLPANPQGFLDWIPFLLKQPYVYLPLGAAAVAGVTYLAVRK